MFTICLHTRIRPTNLCVKTYEYARLYESVYEEIFIIHIYSYHL